MKKILILTAVLSLACAANSFALTAPWLAEGTTADPGGGTQTIVVTGQAPAASFKPSSGVVIGYAAQTNGVAYTEGAYHTSGTFVYGTSSVDTTIYRKEVTGDGGNSIQANVIAAGLPPAPADANAGPAMGALWTEGAWTASK